MSYNLNLSLGPIKNFVLLGYCDFIKDLEIECKKLKINFYFITTKDQIKNCESIPKNTLVTNIFNKNKVKNFLIDVDFSDSNSFALSIGARWIFSKQIIDKLFFNKIFNCHGARLPIDRGGGGFSWRIMRGDRIGIVLMHQMNEGIDTGPIIFHDDYVIPKDKITPKEISLDYRIRLKKFLLNFINSLSKQTKKFDLYKQTNISSTYLPRLSTNKNGYINWSWNPIDIQNFILAFEEPYEGAKTYLNNELVFIKKTQLHVGEIGNHPYQSGIISRKGKGWLIVMLDSKYSLIIEYIGNKKNKNILSKIKIGDRFYTPSNKLDDTKKFRSIIKNKIN